MRQKGLAPLLEDLGLPLLRLISRRRLLYYRGYLLGRGQVEWAGMVFFLVFHWKSYKSVFINERVVDLIHLRDCFHLST